MLWFYERNNTSLRLETRYDNQTAEYVAVVHHQDGQQQTERFQKREAFRDWLVAFDQLLEAERWARQGPPVILPNGWPDKTPQM